MPPIYMIHWGDPSKEAPELPGIAKIWTEQGAKFNYVSRYVPELSPTNLCEALRQSFEDPECQIVYLTCHGNDDGFCYSRDAASNVPYAHFANWLNSYDLDSDENSRWLVLGSCRAMSPGVVLERSMPKWLTLLAGFSGEPVANDVADLISGLSLNLADYGSEIGKAISAAADDNRGKGIDAQFAAMKTAFGVADATFRDSPDRFVSEVAKEHLLIVKRRYPSFAWDPLR